MQPFLTNLLLVPVNVSVELDKIVDTKIGNFGSILQRSRGAGRKRFGIIASYRLLLLLLLLRHQCRQQAIERRWHIHAESIRHERAHNMREELFAEYL